MKEKKKMLLILAAGILIISSAAFCRMHPLYLLPLIISLFVMAFQSEANRYSILAGSLNSLIYTWVYMKFGLYGTALQSALFSFPVQLITFLMWNKNKYRHTVLFKKMSDKARWVLFGGLTLIWIVSSIAFSKIGYEYAVLDSGSTLLGFAIPILTMLAYVEYTVLWIVQIVFTVFLNAQLVMSDFAKLPYFIYGIYNAYCIVLAYLNVRKYYKEQREREV